MGSDDKVLPRAFGSHTSSSDISTPVGKGHTNDPAKDRHRLQEFVQYCPKKEMVRFNLDKERKQGHQSKCKLTEELSKTSNKELKNLELKKLSSTPSSMNNQERPRKQPRKGDHPVRLPSSVEVCPEFSCSMTWICKNSACKAVLTSEDSFCKRCSCCICHKFDDNKDPSLWLVCTSESREEDCCGLSCHIECALQCQKAGVVDLGQFMKLDGSYCCASCGKISTIIGFWKKQLAIAKEARRVDILCYRIYLCYRLLNGTSRFKELHEVVKQAKLKLETEVDSVNGVSAKMGRGIVSRLSVAGDIQQLCSIAIAKADEWLVSVSMSDPKHRDSLPAACKFIFEEITSSSVVIVLKEPSCPASGEVKGYKLWYCKSNELPYKRDPVTFPKDQRRILVSNLQPCTEYAFGIISFTEDGDLGHSESKCFTKSVEIIHKHAEQSGAEGCSSTGKREPSKSPVVGSSGFRVRNLGKIVRLAVAHEEGCYDGLCEDNVEELYDSSGGLKPDTADNDKAQPATARQLDLNVVSVPDLNDEVTPLIESSPETGNGCSLEKDGAERSNGSGDSQTCAVGPAEVPAVESRSERRKRLHTDHEETYDGDSTLVNCSPFSFANGPGPGQLDDNYEYCVKIVRLLECKGHIEKEFRMKFLTWFSLRSTEQERRVVITFIRTLIEEPTSLAGQLLDSFLEIVTCKRPRNGFCSKLWH
uniref:Vernalization insensitive 3-like protein n=1 Tax=Tulipa gesneriana TaxID=13306 RepID=A0A4D6C6Z2_TULGE|nr:vernalization insensitive 3-like protein [Tulipa gesneriana]